MDSERQRSAEAVRALNLSLQEQSSKCGLLEGGKREAEEKLKAEKVWGKGRGLVLPPPVEVSKRGGAEPKLCGPLEWGREGRARGN